MLNILELFFPSNIYCIACGNLIDKSRPYSLCDKCIRDIKWITENTCKICGKALGNFDDGSGVCFECKEYTHNFTKGFSCASYEGPVKEILSGFKYRGHAYYAEKMADIMKDRAEGFIHELGIDLIIPVPMYKKKEKVRGYNQSHLLALRLAKDFEIKFNNEILIKKINTSSMSSLDLSARRINLHNAFGIGYNREKEVEEKNILVIDDVYTTGSTADACAEVLRHSGASKVYIFTFASGVNMKTRFN